MNLWNKLNYKMRLFMLIMAFTWVVAFVLFGIFFYREKAFKAESINAHLQIYNAQLSLELQSNYIDGVNYANRVNALDSIRFTIMDSLGRVMYDTHGVVAGVDYSDRREVVKAMCYGTGYTQNRVSTSDNRHYFYSAMKDGNYIVRSSMLYDMTLIKALENEEVYLWTILIISGALSVLAFYASRRFGQNVARLRDFATLAEKGELAEISEFDFRNDELGETSRHIINIYNKSQRLAKERDSYYQNLLDEVEETARIKHQLTTNINHELKTPVHAIQGCLETILANRDTLDRQHIISFVEKSYGQVSRLSDLLNDISTITRITDAPRQIKREEVDLSGIIREIKEDVEVLPQPQSMRINLNIGDAMPIVGNRGLLESIFRNLVNNSLAYSGGRDIFILLLSETDTHYMFSFSDNGVGVSENHYPRLFERFYRIDDGRSRVVGGTGLGLSIVKNSVLFHGGDIKVRTRVGGGLEFLFSLSKI